MNLPDLTQELAAALRDVIQDTDDSCAESDPETTYEDLAARLILRLSNRLLTVAPVHHTAAARILDIFTGWMKRMHGGRVEIEASESKGFRVLLDAQGWSRRCFYGESAQDAYAQAAQTIHLDEEL